MMGARAQVSLEPRRPTFAFTTALWCEGLLMDVDAFVAGARVSLYIIVPPSRLVAYRPLLRLWLSGLILAATQRPKPLGTC